MWTPEAKMTKAAWAKLVRKLKKLLTREGTTKHTKGQGLAGQREVPPSTRCVQERGHADRDLPTSSSDYNPIETVWARLRLDKTTAGTQYAGPLFFLIFFSFPVSGRQRKKV